MYHICNQITWLAIGSGEEDHRYKERDQKGGQKASLIDPFTTQF
jgi:hypothetical protein